MSLIHGGIRRRSPIGLDIGAGGTRAVQLTRRGPQYVVSASAASVWPAQNSGDVAAPAGEMSGFGRHLRGLLGQMSFCGRKVIAGLNSPDVSFQALDVPRSIFSDEKTDADQVVRWEIERLMTDSGDGVETRHWCVPETRASSSTAIGVAANRDVILQTVDRCRSGGLYCVGVDANAVALSRFGAKLNKWDPEQIWGVLDVGLLESRLVLCTEDTPILVRRVGGGGGVWTERIAHTLGLSAQAAEIQKREHGIALVNGERSNHTTEAQRGSRERLPAILLGALRSELRKLAAEIRRSYEYVLSCYPSRHAAEFVLVGGGAALQHLPEFLSDALGIPVKRASDYLNQSHCMIQALPGARHEIESIASAVGLAIEA